MTTELPVLIVGAGPTGLIMAAVLHRYGVAFRLIDKKPQPTQTSNALALHAATLRLLDDLGLADTFLRRGYPLERARLHMANGVFAEIELSQLESRYAFVLSLAQSETEAILAEYLQAQGVTIERGTALTHLEELEQHARVTLTREQHTETLDACYVVAADGSHSTVRHLANIPFAGNEFPTQFILADVHLTNPMPKYMLNVFYADSGILAAFPFNEHDVRLIADVPADSRVENEPAAILAAIQQYAAQRSQQQLHIDQYQWVSSFWIHNRCLPALRHGNLFFCGDAAHIHSPVGGQGMNAGMQDAYNLGWKLGMVLQQQAHPSLLDSYQQERLPVAQRIVRQTALMTRWLLARHAWTRRLRNLLLRALLKSKLATRKMVRHLSMLDTHYQPSNAICTMTCLSNRSPQPGEMVPEIPLTGKNFWLLVFSGPDLKLSQLDQIKNILLEMNHLYSASLNTCVITPTPLDVPATQIHDADLSLHQRFHVSAPGLCLVRPDKYIAFCSADLNALALKQCLAKVLQGKR